MLPRLLHATEMLFALTQQGLLYVHVMRDSLEMDQPAMVCELVEVKDNSTSRHATQCLFTSRYSTLLTSARRVLAFTWDAVVDVKSFKVWLQLTVMSETE